MASAPVPASWLRENVGERLPREPRPAIAAALDAVDSAVASEPIEVPSRHVEFGGEVVSGRVARLIKRFRIAHGMSEIVPYDGEMSILTPCLGGVSATFSLHSYATTGKLRHMEGPVREAKRGHNCEADSNKRLVSSDWDGDVLVTTFRCRRCDRTWEERKTTAEIEAGLRAQTQRQIDEQLRGGVW